jgi:hypothetical protein
MSSINDKTSFAPEPLYPGEYYLVDCAEPISRFMQTPYNVRMHMASDSEEMTEYDMVDVELTELVDALVMRNPVDHLDNHADQLLEEGTNVLREEAIMQGIHKEGQVYTNTPVQTQHADAVLQLGFDLSRLLKQYGFYHATGMLAVKYHQLLPNGLVVFRKEPMPYY